MTENYIKTLRLIRKEKDAPEKELIKEFARYIGCFVYDTPVEYYEDVIKLLEDKKKHDVDIVLNIKKEELEKIKMLELTINTERIIVFVDFDIEEEEVNKDTRIKESLKDIVEKIGEERKTICENNNDKEKVNEIVNETKDSLIEKFVENNLFEYLQSKRSLRILNMGEWIGEGGEKHKISNSSFQSKDSYIENMLRTFCNVYDEAIKTKTNSVYSMYAQANLGRRIRELMELISEKELEKINSDNRITKPSVKELEKVVKRICQLDDEYFCVYFLVAGIYQTDMETDKYLEADIYYKKICDQLKKSRSPEFYAFAKYQWGSYSEKIWHDYEWAMECYHDAAKIDENLYQPRFKIACREARVGHTKEAMEGFNQTLDILYKYNTCPKGLQYAFKVYIWMAKLAMRDDFQAANEYLELAYNVAMIFAKNEQFKKIMDLQKYKNYIEYHKKSEPVRILFQIVLDLVNMIGNKELANKIMKEYKEVRA